MRTKLKTALVVHIGERTFVRNDIEILSKEYNVREYFFKPFKKALPGLLSFFKQFFYLLFNINQLDILYIWFADYHSLLPVLFAKIFGKKSFLVIGGYDVCRIPELKYGVFYKKRRGFFAINSMKYCTLNLPVSYFVDRIVKTIAPNAKRKLIYNGVNLKEDEKANTAKQKIVLTVALIPNEQVFFRKGVDTFIEVAKLLPQYEFICVGINKDGVGQFISDIPLNVKLHKQIKQEELIEYYAKAKVYAQFSRMDTFCMTLSEAMLYKNIPIITNVGGMPEVMGDTGYLVKRNPEQIAQTIQNIMNDVDLPNSSQPQRIKTMFLLEHREKKLLETIQTILN